jgi:hypothetical protein
MKILSLLFSIFYHLFAENYLKMVSIRLFDTIIEKSNSKKHINEKTTVFFGGYLTRR